MKVFGPVTALVKIDTVKLEFPQIIALHLSEKSSHGGLKDHHGQIFSCATPGIPKAWDDQLSTHMVR
jgi:hypothetical protein